MLRHVVCECGNCAMHAKNDFLERKVHAKAQVRYWQEQP